MVTFIGVVICLYRGEQFRVNEKRLVGVKGGFSARLLGLRYARRIHRIHDSDSSVSFGFGGMVYIKCFKLKSIKYKYFIGSKHVCKIAKYTTV